MKLHAVEAFFQEDTTYGRSAECCVCEFSEVDVGGGLPKG